MTGSLSPLQTRWLWLLRCLLVTDKFLNKIIRFGALQSALLDYWLSTKISCPADTRVCSQHSKWAKTDLGRGEGWGQKPPHSCTPSPSQLPLWPRTIRGHPPVGPSSATHQPSPNHEGPGSSVPSAVPEARRPRKQRSSSHCCVTLDRALSVSESAFPCGKAAIRLNNLSGTDILAPHYPVEI